MSAFVREQARMEYGDAMAFGTGTYNGTAFEWVLTQNSDYLAEFKINILIDKNDRMKVGRVLDKEKRPWEVQVHTAVRETALSTSNDWAFTKGKDAYCHDFTGKDGRFHETCNHHRVADDQVAEVNQRLPFLQLTVSGYLRK